MVQLSSWVVYQREESGYTGAEAQYWRGEGCLQRELVPQTDSWRRPSGLAGRNCTAGPAMNGRLASSVRPAVAATSTFFVPFSAINPVRFAVFDPPSQQLWTVKEASIHPAGRDGVPTSCDRIDMFVEPLDNCTARACWRGVHCRYKTAHAGR